MFAVFEIQLLCYISNLCFHMAMCMFASWHEYNIFLFFYFLILFIYLFAYLWKVPLEKLPARKVFQ